MTGRRLFRLILVGVDGYLVGAIVMIIGGIIQATMGVEAAPRDLEDIAAPLSVTEEELEEPGEEADPYTLGRGQERGAEHAPRQRDRAAEPNPSASPTRDASGGDR